MTACNIKANIENFLQKHNLTTPELTFIVGFSGGEDSTCLLYTMNELRQKYSFNVIAAHLNHNWRGEEALLEQKKCKEFAQKLHIEFYTETLDENTKCTELYAREARYAFFERCAKNFNTPYIITAHTKTDNAETVLFRVIKGTGLVGLKGIPEVRLYKDLKILRPMLNISRREVIKFNDQNGLTRNCDSSNQDIKYARNRIRNKIIPDLKTINPDIEKALNDLSAIANDEDFIINEYLNKIKSEISEKNKFISKLFWAQSEQLQKKLIYEIVKKYKTEYDQKDIDEIYQFAVENKTSKSGKTVSVTTNCWLCVSEEYIYTIVKDEKDAEIFVNIEREGTYSAGKKTISIEKFNGTTKPKFSANDLTIYADLSETQFPLQFRTRNSKAENGYFIKPFGMKENTKLKKYLSSKHINRLKKENILLLCKDNEVLWVPEYGTSEKIRINSQPTHKITICEEEE